jgi:hypothetical protein
MTTYRIYQSGDWYRAEYDYVTGKYDYTHITCLKVCDPDGDPVEWDTLEEAMEACKDHAAGKKPGVVWEGEL